MKDREKEKGEKLNAVAGFAMDTSSPKVQWMFLFKLGRSGGK